MEGLTGRERSLAALRAENQGIPPIIPPFQGTWALNTEGVPLRDAIEDPRVNAGAQLRAAQRCGFDAFEGMWDWLTMAEAMGCGVKIKDGMGAVTVDHVLADGIDDVPAPDPSADGRALSNRDALELCAEGDSFVYSTVPGPFTLAGELRGLEQLMMDSILEPETCQDVVSLSTRAIEGYAGFYAAHSEGVLVCESSGSPDLVPPELFTSVVLPAITRPLQAARSEGRHPMLYIAGDSSPLLEDLSRLPMDLLSVDRGVDLGLCLGTVDCAVAGGIDAVAILSDDGCGAAADGIASAIEAVRGQEGRFFLAASSDLSAAPIGNVECWSGLLRSHYH